MNAPVTGVKPGTSLVENVEYGYGLGLAFTPLKGKRPILPGWQKRPRESLEQVKAWARKGNVGLRTGGISGVVVIDVDEGGDISGLDLPATVTVNTGGNGLHLYCCCTEPISNSSGTLGPNIDVKGERGQVVYPGSIHPDTGQRYEWAEGREPWNVEMAELPRRIVDVLKGKQEAPGGRNAPRLRHIEAVVDREIRAVLAAPAGERNTTLNTASFNLGRLVGGGCIERDLVVERLASAGEEAGLGRTEITATIRSGLEAGSTQPRTLPGAQRRAPRTSGPVLTNLGDVRPEPVRWLWPERIALGKLTLLAGDPGLGKSFITLDMAARVSTGNDWPDRPATNTPGGVVLLSAEDDLADTIRPRLDAAGADVSRVIALQAVRVRDPESGVDRQSPFNLAADLPELGKAIRATQDCRLVVLDPITAYLGKTDSHRNADIRGLLAPLSELAARCGIAILAVTHLRKGEGPAMYRAMGSLAFVAAARAVYGVARDPDDPMGERRFVLPIKNNLGNDKDGLAYRLVAVDGGLPAVAWEADPIRVSADEALGPRPPGRPGPDPQERNEAAEWLRGALADGPRPAKELFAEADTSGIARGTLKRAKAMLGVVGSKGGWNEGWTWQLPEGADEGTRQPSQITCAPSGEPAPLRENKGLAGSLGDTHTPEGTEGAQVPESRGSVGNRRPTGESEKNLEYV